jgi:hypothetical protein
MKLEEYQEIQKKGQQLNEDQLVNIIQVNYDCL